MLRRVVDVCGWALQAGCMIPHVEPLPGRIPEPRPHALDADVVTNSSAQPLLPQSADALGRNRTASPLEPHVRRLLQVLLEGVVGRRPIGQLAAWATYPVLAQVREWSSRTDRVHLTPASLRIQHPGAMCAEVTVRLHVGGRAVRPRSVAMALRIDLIGKRWVCTALDAGPAALRPLVTPPVSHLRVA